MKSVPTPHIATATLTRDLKVEFGASGSVLKYSTTVPAGTACKKLDGGSEPWVVADLSFLKKNSHSIEYHDADHYGIRIPESELSNITPVTPEARRRPGLR